MNTKLLEFGEPIFQRIKEAVSQQKYQLAMSIIQTTPPPAEWVVELPSKSRKGETYKTIPLDILEGVMKIVFGEAYIASINSPTITQDKSGRFAVTVLVDYFYKPFDANLLPFMAFASILIDTICAVPVFAHI